MPTGEHTPSGVYHPTPTAAPRNHTGATLAPGQEGGSRNQREEVFGPGAPSTLPAAWGPEPSPGLCPAGTEVVLPQAPPPSAVPCRGCSEGTPPARVPGA